jgi:dTDP-4-dehydrorhamnose 3,5-epimerase
MPFTFTKLAIPDLVLIQPRIFPDDRGFFAETYKASEFAANGITEPFVQDNHSLSGQGVLRGLHYQLPPQAQGKLVRVASGRIWDVAVDIRKGSPTFGRWCGAELSGENLAMFWIPPGFAHGFVCLSESVHLLYKCTAEYSKAAECGIRWDDPDLGIQWPLSDVQVSARDAGLPAFRDANCFPGS